MYKAIRILNSILKWYSIIVLYLCCFYKNVDILIERLAMLLRSEICANGKLEKICPFVFCK